MFGETIAAANLQAWPVAGLLIFFTFMLGVFAWALRPKARQSYERLRFSALDDGGERP